PDDPNLSFTLRVTHDGRYLLLMASESGGSFNGLDDRLFYKDLHDGYSEVKELFENTDATYAFEGNNGTHFWIRTTHRAPQARLVEVDIERPEPAHWNEVIPEADAAMQAVSVIGDRFVVQYVKDARTIARIYDFRGQLHHEIDHLAPSMFGFADHPDSHETYYSASQLYDPGTSYRLDVRTGETSLYFRPELVHHPDDFVTRQVFFESKDGTRVPMFILHRKDLEFDGAHPVFLYGYGAWAWSAFPWQRHMVPWMELGGVYAVVNIRGGGEYGEAWHQDGIRQKKQNGIDDFIAAAEWLIENNYTSPSKMIANGGSASGILPGAAIIQRPDLFGAAVINYPTLDQLRYVEFGSARSWIPEFGTPEDPDDFEALYAYSPYHNLKEGVCYPPTWIQVGDKDDTTTPMHGYKFTAAMQAAQGCDNPVLLKIAWGAGHSAGLTPEQRRETLAEELAFLIKVLDVDVSHALSSTSGQVMEK
ncbi:MAG: prolyl oligopeptidase family serine peptidase, partial [Rhodothermales bacterium]